MKNQNRLRILPLLLFFSIAITSFGQVNTSMVGGGYPTGTPIMGIAYGNSVYVAIGYYGTIIKSTDGINWVTVKTSTFLNCTYQKVAFGNGLFVGTSSAGDIVTSPDGVNWTIRVSGTTNPISDVAYVNGRWIIVASNNTALTSLDGASWTSFSIGAGASDGLTSIVYAQGKYFIGVRENSTGNSRSYYSVAGPGGSWSSALITAGGSLNKVQYLNNKFFAFNSTPSVYTSSDGISWAVASSSRINSPSQIFNGFYDGLTYYLFGSSPEYSYCSVFTSIDGVNFILQTQTSTLVPQVSAYLNGRYFIGGNEGLVSSTTGSSWSFISSNMNSIATNGSIYVAVGQNTTNEGAIQTSANYTTWVAVIPGIIKPLNGVTYGNGKFVAVGNLNGTTSTYAVSADGLIWSTGSTGFADVLRAVAFGNNKYVAVGLSGRIISSTNGTTWSAVENVAGYNYYGISYVNGYFVAVGGSVALSGLAKVKYSSDGATWTDVSPAGLSGHFHAVAYGGGKYMLVGRDNTTGIQKFFSMTSSNITSAAAYSVAAVISTPEGELGTLGYGAVAYNNSVFTAVANLKVTPFSGYVLTSANATTWTATPINSATRLRAIVTVGTGFKALGANPGAYVSISVGSTLPLRLTDFTGYEKNGSAQLDWRTTNEENTNRFEIEKSEDGRSFTRIGTVLSKNVAGINLYGYADNDLKPGIHYYRLKMIDNDAKFVYSQVIRIGGAVANDVINVYPNPATDYVTLSLPSNIPARLSVYNNRGEKIFQKQVEGNSIPININSLTAGTYLVQVIQGEKTYTEKIVKR